MGHRTVRTMAAVAAAGLVAALVVTGPVGATASMSAPIAPATPGAQVDCAWAAARGVTLEQAFTRSATASGVPAAVLKGVAYLQSRWDDHAGKPSADGGYGPMNLTDVPAGNVPEGEGKGDGTLRAPQSVQTARLGAELSGQSVATVRTVAAANICAGAAVLSSYRPAGATADVNDWTAAVARFGAATAATGTGEDFAVLVYDTLRKGAVRTTADGQRVALSAHPTASAPRPMAAERTDCPVSLGCEWLEAPYLKEDPAAADDTTAYGNHDLADRTGPGGPKLQYIVIHDTEGTYQGSVNLVQDPTYLAWNYTVRSSDGHIAQHLKAQDVGWHAGNWYVNMHSIGIEHEGKAGTDGWFTEAMYQQSATLVKYLGKKYDIPLDPAHIIGHDAVPGTVAGMTKSVHWDPGPYWDWEHYFALLGAPIGGKAAATTKVSVGDAVTVRPGYAGNRNTLVQCEEQSPGSGACETGAATNFAVLYQQPSLDAPMATDVGTHPTGDAAGTTMVNDVSARAQAGNSLVVAAVQGEWVKVSWAGEFAWIRNPASDPVLVRTPMATVQVKEGATSAPVYGRAYPEQAAYPTTIPYQTVKPVEYTLKPGQKYTVVDKAPVTDYYRATSYDGSLPGDRTDLRGQDRYYQVSIAHRTFFVRAADVTLVDAVVLTNTKKPTISGTPAVGKVLTGLSGTWTGGVKTVAFQWKRDGKAISGASSQSYTVKKADAGRAISIAVTGSAPNATSVTATSKAVRIRR